MGSISHFVKNLGSWDGLVLSCHYGVASDLPFAWNLNCLAPLPFILEQNTCLQQEARVLLNFI